jgi:hypothetical protein
VIKLDEIWSDSSVAGNAVLLTTPSQVQTRHRLGSPNSRHPLGVFALYVVGMTVLFTCLANQIRGSVLLTWLSHGAINTLIFVNPAVDIVQRWWMSAAVYGIAALIVVLVTGPCLTRRRGQQPSACVESAARS